MSKARRRQAKRTRECPLCSSREIRPIVYGLPSFEGFQQAERGKVELGGCTIDPENPNWRCVRCRHAW